MNRTKMNFCFLVVAICFISSSGVHAQATSSVAAEPRFDKIELSDDGNSIQVNVDGELFTQFEYRDFSKPIFYPVQLAKNLAMTRNFPMKKVVGEAFDHPHHMSMWIGHEVNGVDFWACTTGDIVFQKIESIDRKKNAFTVRNHWVKKSDRSVVLTELTRYEFGADADSRWIDADIRFQATAGEVTFDDTKEGLFAIRTHPNLRLAPRSKTDRKIVVGSARNDSSVEGKAIWGKPAKWLDYSGVIDGEGVGIALFDHPENLRHPTTWHAREYGLVAANPFGLHYFEGAEKGAGAYTIAKGDELRLRYQVLFYRGEFDAEKTEERYQKFGGESAGK